MGGFCDVSSNYQDPRFSKHVYDNVHGNIYLDPLSLKFIDTEQFQRLRDLKQLGMVHMVYPGAVHTRFEHSLGVYSLAGDAIHKLKNQQGLELGIDHFDIQTVKLAGLLHDLGHGPFSHLFEREFLPMVNGSEWSHEQMSVEMIDHIVDGHHIEIDAETTKSVKEMILASSKYSMDTSGREKHFLYDIVANGRNGVDVDKFDYIVRDCRASGLGCSFHFQRLLETMRVMGDEICYRDKDYLTIHKLFSTRADLHRTVYTHSKVKAIELMILDALVRANDYLQIASYIQDPSQYWKLDDTIIKTIETAPDQQLKESRDLILRVRRRDLYQFCNEYVVPKDNLQNFKNVSAQEVVCSQKNGGVTLREEDIVVSNVRIDLSCGRCDPLERIKFFKDYDSEEKFSIANDRVSHLLPTSYQDMIVRVDSFEDIFESSLNLEETHFREGYDEGYADGLLSGKEEGLQVGLKSGFQAGEELGFYRGCIDVWNSAIRIDPSCFSARIQKTIKQMDELLHKYPISDPENESVSDIMDSLRLKFRAICATLNVKLEYNGYPKVSGGENVVF